MNLEDLINKNQSKILILIKSRLHENDISGFLKDLDGFDVLNLPLLYLGTASNKSNWRVVYE